MKLSPIPISKRITISLAVVFIAVLAMSMYGLIERSESISLAISHVEHAGGEVEVDRQGPDSVYEWFSLKYLPLLDSLKFTRIVVDTPVEIDETKVAPLLISQDIQLELHTGQMGEWETVGKSGPLTTLHIWENQHRWTELRNFASLTRLHIYGKCPSNACCEVIGGLENLEELTITGRDVTDRCVNNLAALKKLRTLILSECSSVTDSGSKYLADLPRLRNLVMSGTCITNESLSVFKRMRSLMYLDVSDTPLASTIKGTDIAGVRIRSATPVKYWGPTRVREGKGDAPQF